MGFEVAAIERDTRLGRQFVHTYEQLRALASAHLAHERRGHTLQPTALVHEAYLRLADAPLEWTNRPHFLALISRSMRQVLARHAHTRRALKRGGGNRREALTEAPPILPQTPAEAMALDELLERLACIDPSCYRVVELRFFAGLSIRETASMLGVSESSVDRTWRFARAWLYSRLGATS